MRRVLLLVSALLLGACAVGSAPAQEPAPTREELSDRATLPAEQAPASARDRFGGKLFMVLLDDKTHPSLRGGRSLWALTEELTYAPSDGSGVITVPKGFVTDLASIPQFFWDLLPPDGPWVKAAVIHDYLYYTQGTGVWKCHPRSITSPTDYTRPQADWILRDAMRDRGVDGFRRNIIYDAVRFGGQHGWDASPGRNEAKCKAKPASAAS